MLPSNSASCHEGRLIPMCVWHEETGAITPSLRDLGSHHSFTECLLCAWQPSMPMTRPGQVPVPMRELSRLVEKVNSSKAKKEGFQSVPTILLNVQYVHTDSSRYCLRFFSNYLLAEEEHLITHSILPLYQKDQDLWSFMGSLGTARAGAALQGMGASPFSHDFKKLWWKHLCI